MVHALTPLSPEKVMVIRDVTPNIVTCSTPFWRFGRVKIGGRGTIVRLQPSGALAVFSPTALTTEVKEKVNSMGGEVKYLIAPDIEHHIFLGPWYKEYPGSKAIGPEGLVEKRKKQHNEDVPFAVEYSAKTKETTTVDADFDSNFDVEYVDGHANKELVFNYKPEKTMIEGDLLFNLPATEQFSKADDSATTGIWTRIFNSINNTKGEALGQRRLIWYLISSGNRASFNKSMSKISKWDFDRIIPCHGDVIETGGKRIFDTIMAWHLEANKKSN